MFHLAPVGLPQRSSKSVHPSQCTRIERDVMVAVVDISENAMKQKIAYNLSHPDTKALLKCLDVFMSHGLITSDKCYWLFVKEFLPMIEQQDLRRQWNCTSSRALSIAWLKDSLNRSNLHFQLLSFAKCDSKIKARWYCKGACIRNSAILRRVCDSVGRLNSVEFEIEKPYVFRTEEVPIALPTSPPVPNVVASNNNSASSPVDVDVGVNHLQNSTLSTSFNNRVSASSFSQIAAGSYLGVSAQDFPAVNLPSSVHEPFLSTAKDRDYILDEMVRAHRKRMNGYIQEEQLEQFNSNETRPSVDDDEGIMQYGKSELIGDLRTPDKPDSKREAEDLFEGDENLVNLDALAHALNVDDKVNPVQSEDSCKSSTLLGSAESSDEQPIGDCENNQLEGEIILNPGEIVQLLVDVFRENAERFQRMFMVYTGHCSGQPILRYLVITDQFVYFLSNGPATPEIDEVKPSSFIEANELPIFNDSFFDHKVKYTTHLVLSLQEIDYVTMGIDNQVLCLHLKKRRQLARDLDLRTYGIEAGSKPLGKVIACALGQAISTYQSEMGSNKATRKVVLTNSTQLAITLTKFVRQELQSDQVNILHHALIYWQQDAHENGKRKANELEGYLYYRSVNPKSWTKKYDDWQHSYFIFRGFMLYQFADSSCKYAQRSYNIRESVAQVFDADLKNEEKYVFEITLMTDDSSEILQFSCNSQEEMKKWIDSITLALSVSDDLAIPVACMLVVTDSSFLFCQEGANCLFDGFMRSLGILPIKEVDSVYLIRTEPHNALVIKRQNGAFDWILLRDEGELKRLIDTLTEKWEKVVEDAGQNPEEKPLFNELYMKCIKMPDLWRDRQ